MPSSPLAKSVVKSVLDDDSAASPASVPMSGDSPDGGHGGRASAAAASGGDGRGSPTMPGASGRAGPFVGSSGASGAASHSGASAGGPQGPSRASTGAPSGEGEQFLPEDRLAEAVIIATQDAEHIGPALAFARQGYHMLLEKPMATNPRDCLRICRAVQKSGKIFACGHVLRYTPYMTMIKGLIDDGTIGDVVNVQHLEPIGHWHFAHSYVRGQWSSEASSSFMLLAKCCHDVDLIRHMVGEKERWLRGCS